MTERSSPDPRSTEEEFTPNVFGPDTRHDFQVLKDGDLFAVFSHSGAINSPNAAPSEARSKDGLFFRDTRYLSRLVWYLNGTLLTEMGHSALPSEAGFRSDLANTELVDSRGTDVPAFALHLQLNRFLGDGLYDRILIRNHSLTTVELDFSLDIWADFRDLFEVRGALRPLRGELQPPLFANGSTEFGYATTDGRYLSTSVQIEPQAQFDSGRARLSLTIPPKGQQIVDCVVRVAEKSTPDATEADHFALHGEANVETAPPAREDAHKAMVERFARRIGRTQRVTSSRPAFDAWLERSSADLAMLTSELSTGPYPYAGVPWFSAPFGRDGIVAAMQTLWLDPELAAGVLDFLAATQATRHDAFSDAAPGKILHEHRNGEMARVGAVPFHHYYGGIDQTLLFIILARDYWRRTADRDRIVRLEPALRAALDWASSDGDLNRDGFIEYARSSESGLRNQGWKDSEDAIFHADGELGQSPIALVEVQGYHVAALRAAADLMEVLGRDDEAPTLRQRADDLVDRIDEAFWDDELGTFCIAIDGEGRSVRVSSSNAGHLLFCDALLDRRRERLIETFRSSAFKSGWGIRTLSTEAIRYNPMGYHNGSVWPHDTSIIAAGLALSGDNLLAAEITGELFDASGFFPEHRLPELWCGISREESDRPVAYPSACSPQAWSAGAPFLCLRACLGLEIDAPMDTITLTRPVLPSGIDRVEINGLQVGEGEADIRFQRKADGSAEVEVVHADRVQVKVMEF